MKIVFFELVDSTYKLSSTDLMLLQKIFSESGFKNLFNGKHMSVSETKKYIEWVKKSSSEGTLYLYLVRDKNNKVVAGFDLQRKSESEATIGFWKNSKSDVRMYNLLPEFIKVAREHKFSLLDAYTEPGNHKAIILLERVGFANCGIVKGRTRDLVKFWKKI